MANRRGFFFQSFLGTWLLPLLFSLAAVSSCFGQGFGTIVGTVTDPSGAVIAGASVRVTDPAIGITREEKTNDQGYYVLPSLRPATYNLSFSASGFASTTQNGITLLA